jgi:hypothetical protein
MTTQARGVNNVNVLPRSPNDALPLKPQGFADSPDSPDWSHWNPNADTDRFHAIPSEPEDGPRSKDTGAFRQQEAFG